MLSLLSDLVADLVGGAIGGALGRLFREAAGERRVAAAYRDRSRRCFAGRWRHGSLRRSGDGLGWVPDRLRSIRRSPVSLADIRIVRERDVKPWEQLFVNAAFKVLICETRNGPVQLAVDRADLPFLRAVTAGPRQERAQCS
ncbi:DUF2550 family protein [Micromonospora siamensis]|uniref:DUF2550 family protein n=1 Tax=Micromonospora siamensis TaxID=299152 RepID=UPI000B5AF25B|nr:DUF2550 family protein [Micromonospora siamensis]